MKALERVAAMSSDRDSATVREVGWAVPRFDHPPYGDVRDGVAPIDEPILVTGNDDGIVPDYSAEYGAAPDDPQPVRSTGTNAMSIILAKGSMAAHFP
jgi:hypothetical protein